MTFFQVIAYFNSKVEAVQDKKEQTLSVYEVQEIIRQTSMQFPREKLTVRENHVLELCVTLFELKCYSFFQKFPDLKFKYVEEESPEDFFVPYVWTLAAKYIYWNPKYVKLPVGQT